MLFSGGDAQLGDLELCWQRAIPHERFDDDEGRLDSALRSAAVFVLVPVRRHARQRVLLHHAVEAQEALQGIGWLHEQPKMVVTSLLIYSPDEDTKTAVKLIDQYLTDHLKLRHTTVELKRLTEVIAGNRITQPDLRHWRYVLQNVQGFWKPDLTMQFGGLNENEVQACAGTAQKRQHAAAIAETCLQEVVNNNVTT
ncbi:Heat shockprotein [Trichinella pseudospiralis]